LRGVLAPVLQAGLQVEQTLPRMDDLDKLLAGRIVGLALGLAEGFGKPGDHLRIDHIVFGQPPSRSGEAAHPLRIDDPDFDIGLAQRLGPVPLVAAACLHHCLGHLVLAKPRDQLPPSLHGAWERPPLRQRANARIHLGHVDTDDNEIVLCHHPAPFLARSGLEAHATVRVEEDTGSVPCSPSGSRAFEHERAQIQRRAVGENRPFAHSTKLCGHKSPK
jgi:hypothetical protein